MLANAFPGVDLARTITIFVHGLVSSVINLAFLPTRPHHIHPPHLLFVNYLPKESSSFLHLVNAYKEFPLVMLIDSISRYFQVVY